MGIRSTMTYVTPRGLARDLERLRLRMAQTAGTLARLARRLPGEAELTAAADDFGPADGGAARTAVVAAELALADAEARAQDLARRVEELARRGRAGPFARG